MQMATIWELLRKINSQIVITSGTVKQHVVALGLVIRVLCSAIYSQENILSSYPEQMKKIRKLLMKVMSSLPLIKTQRMIRNYHLLM